MKQKLGYSTFYLGQPLVTGIIVILAVWLDIKTRRRAQ